MILYDNFDMIFKKLMLCNDTIHAVIYRRTFHWHYLHCIIERYLLKKSRKKKTLRAEISPLRCELRLNAEQ